jgi:CheY-like chemotaxis protein
MNKVLVIEDNENNLKLMTVLLKNSGYNIITAKTGREGIDMALQENPDFILLDIQLPDINGRDVIKEIRKSGKVGDLPVIALTALAMSGDRQEMLEAGCTGYIEKPIDTFRFIDQMKKIIGDADENPDR